MRILIILCILLTQIVAAQQHQVCSSCPSTSVKEAVAKAQPHDTIYIRKGTYKEYDIRIDKPLTVIGEELPVIDSDFKGYAFQLLSDSITLKGLKIINVGRSYTKDYSAVYVSKSRNITLENNVLENIFFGFLIEKSHDLIIRNNHISSKATDEAAAGNGIHLWHSSNAHIANNELHGLRDGLYFEFVSHSKIENNNSYNNVRYGIHFMFSNHNEYNNNVFRANNAGVAVMFSKFINMTGNSFLDNWGTASYGLLLKEIYDADIINNTFRNNTIAINLEGSTRMNYIGNTFENNGWAVKVAGACYKNVFRANNFKNNSFDMAYNSNLNDNEFDGNYWSDYTGYDLDRDGIGDVPYRPVKLFSYVVNKTPETIVLLRSLFVDIINFSERVTPVFTPENLLDHKPLMQPTK
ncbi:MAG: nitrous oxide reductase family maturation protein NosD [Capnocytophaga sp.]|nr:nitrous oxide reductase family maturation protein NosD [Capnocytophaga sp.]